jgi:hypothetical protein
LAEIDRLEQERDLWIEVQAIYLRNGESVNLGLHTDDNYYKRLTALLTAFDYLEEGL